MMKQVSALAVQIPIKKWKDLQKRLGKLDNIKEQLKQPAKKQSKKA